ASEHSKEGLDPADLGLIALVEDALLDALGAQQPAIDQDPHVLAERWMAHADLVRHQRRPHPVAHQVAVDLRRKVLARLLQPVEDLQAPRGCGSAPRWRAGFPLYLHLTTAA